MRDEIMALPADQRVRLLAEVNYQAAQCDADQDTLYGLRRLWAEAMHEALDD